VYLETAAVRLGECLVYLAASGDKERAEKLLKERRWLLDYDPRSPWLLGLCLGFSAWGRGRGRRRLWTCLSHSFHRSFWPALLMLAGRLQRDEALKNAPNYPPRPPKLCVDAVAAAAGNRVAAERLKSEIESEAPEARLLLDKVDGRTLVEVLAPMYSSARLAFMLLAAVEGRADAVRLHGLLGLRDI
jgi:hypothetical protein